MLTEEVVMSKGGTEEFNIPVSDLILPDPRILSLCLTKEEGRIILWCYTQAEELLTRIRKRNHKEKFWNHFRYDVPDLWPIARNFRRHDCEVVRALWLSYHALVKHFMPFAKEVPYGEGNVSGVRFEGRGWYTRPKD